MLLIFLGDSPQDRDYDPEGDDLAFVIRKCFLDSPVESPKCEGCFCDGATWRAEGDHDMDLNLKGGQSNPKFNQGPKVWPKG